MKTCTQCGKQIEYGNGVKRNKDWLHKNCAAIYVEAKKKQLFGDSGPIKLTPEDYE